MDIDIHLTEAKLDIQNGSGEAACEKRIFVGLLKRGLNCGALERTAVYEEILHCAVAAACMGRGNIAAYLHGLVAAAAFDKPAAYIAAEESVDAAFNLSVAGGEENLFTVAYCAHAHFRVGEGAFERSSKAGACLGLVALHEFEAGGGVVEKVFDNHCGAFGAADGAHLVDIARGQQNAGALTVALAAGAKLNLAYSGNCRKSFAAEAEGCNAFKAALVAQLARCVAQECNARILGAHAAAIVGNADVCHSAAADFYCNVFCACINRVFGKLLHCGSRALHHLARRDKVGNVGGEYIDIRHSVFPPSKLISNSLIILYRH